jgi:hypothetical protein
MLGKKKTKVREGGPDTMEQANLKDREKKVGRDRGMGTKNNIDAMRILSEMSFFIRY